MVDDGDITYAIRLGAASSTDLDFNNVRGRDVTVTNVNDDTAGILVTPTVSLVTTEAGRTAQFSVRLLTIARSPVTISLTSSDTNEGTVSPALLTFAADGAALMPKRVTVTGVGDSITDGDIGYTIVVQAAVSNDSKYADLNPPDGAVTNLDIPPNRVVATVINGALFSGPWSVVHLRSRHPSKRAPFAPR